ncbi:BAG family molecular chaperone regulator 4-like [Phalaenopsis equestris]|uniref:BAG family molecular chaperone regulator 4-like n=1 Tax=Phalaenopsis equestris TaxID=78828 RepID=UPI0009E36059|nr:BAG family molecular chaperone regulator 4-like [Phalaenopsis equestris]
MIKWRSKKLFEKSSKADGRANRRREIQWELRPGGMLVQKRETDEGDENKMMINVRIPTGSQWHDIIIDATATFGELKVKAAMETGLEAREQKLVFEGKEKEDGEKLHMVGVKP